MRERPLNRNEPRRFSVHGQPSTPRDATCVRRRVDLPGLERRDLREIEDVADVDARPGDLDPAEAVDREVS
jgi:hypothetical protein